MKTHFSILGILAAWLAFTAVAQAADAPKPAAGTTTNAVIQPAKSVFTLPTAPKEGRDPFYPESTRIYETTMAVAKSAVATVTTLTVKGYSVVNGRPIVILNNHSFMTGDEGDVISANGRAHVRCIEIQPGAVVVEVNGTRQVIHF